MGSIDTPTIILYTNHGCPWAHRAHIALSELGLPYKEEIIDLTTPRTKEYLAVSKEVSIHNFISCPSSQVVPPKAVLVAKSDDVLDFGISQKSPDNTC